MYAKIWKIVRPTSKLLMAIFLCSTSLSLHPALAQTVGDGWGNPSFSPTNGRVGYHMISNNYLDSPCAPGQVSAVSFTVTGTVPPGLLPPDVAAQRSEIKSNS